VNRASFHARRGEVARLIQTLRSAIVLSRPGEGEVGGR
jgi:hypothetical protein